MKKCLLVLVTAIIILACSNEEVDHVAKPGSAKVLACFILPDTLFFQKPFKKVRV